MEGVAVVIRKGGKYLMLQKAREKPLPLKWLPLAGAIEEGETVEEAAVRETMEETGLKIRIIGEAAVLKCDYGVEKIHFIVAEWKSGKVRLDPEEADDFGWFAYEEILKLDLMNATRQFFEKHFKPLHSTVMVFQ